LPDLDEILRRRRGAPEDRRVWRDLMTEARRRGLLPAWSLAASEAEPAFDPSSGLPLTWVVPGLTSPFVLARATPPVWVAAAPLSVADVATYLGSPVGYVGSSASPAPFVSARQALELAATLTGGAHQAALLPPRWRLDLPSLEEWDHARARHPDRFPAIPGTHEWTRDVSLPAPRPGAEARRRLAGDPPEELGETESEADVFARLALRGVQPW
jgi:hypothetical protein